MHQTSLFHYLGFLFLGILVFRSSDGVNQAVLCLVLGIISLRITNVLKAWTSTYRVFKIWFFCVMRNFFTQDFKIATKDSLVLKNRWLNLCRIFLRLYVPRFNNSRCTWTKTILILKILKLSWQKYQSYKQIKTC